MNSPHPSIMTDLYLSIITQPFTPSYPNKHYDGDLRIDERRSPLANKKEQAEKVPAQAAISHRNEVQSTGDDPDRHQEYHSHRSPQGWSPQSKDHLAGMD